MALISSKVRAGIAALAFAAAAARPLVAVLSLFALTNMAAAATFEASRGARTLRVTGTEWPPNLLLELGRVLIKSRLVAAT
jgi:hypothetical protein